MVDDGDAEELSGVHQALGQRAVFLAALRRSGAAQAAQIGNVRTRASAVARVIARGPLGTGRCLDLLSGEQLPRIC